MKSLSALATLLLIPALGGDKASAQDTTATEPDTAYMSYSDPPISLPLGIGVRMPSYDRVNGLTLPWGPRLAFGTDRVELDALVSYRSHLGNLDPSIDGYIRPGYGNEIRIFVGRSTFTNDSWIRSDLINSAAVLFVGTDARNYYRADRAALRFTRTLTAAAFTFMPFLGGSLEKDWSTGSLVPDKTPWSVFGRKDSLKMRRPNPVVLKGQISSIVGGTGVEYFRGEVEARLGATVEHAFRSPVERCFFAPGGGICRIERGSFTQGTIHSEVFFPTWGTQTFNFRGHAVMSRDTAPPQRYAYLGGSATLPTVDLLALGGDRLFYAEGEYMIPIERITLRFLGSPFLALRYAVGSAGVRDLPPFIQNLGVGAGISFFRVDYSIDPAGNRSPFSDRSAFSVGVSIPR